MPTVNFFDTFVLYVGQGGIDLDTHTFKISLHNNYTFSAAHNALADVSASQISGVNGYTTGGATLSTVTWTQTSGTAKWDAADVTWTASGGSIGPATDAIIYSDTSSSPEDDLLVCNIAFDAAETAGDGTDFKITFDVSNGIFTIA